MRAAVDESTFRQTLARWPSGVAIVTTDGALGRHGMTASSFCSLSLDPPLVLVCMDRRIRSHHLIEEHGVFAVSVLGRDHIALGRRFAGMEPGVKDRFADAGWETRVTGSPVLADAAAWVDCKVRHAYPGGDHTIFVGEVLDARVPRLVSPLLFHSRAWGQVADPLPEAVTVADVGTAGHLALRAAARRPSARLLDTLSLAGVRVRQPGGRPPAARAVDGRPLPVSALVSGPEEAAAAVAAGATAVEFTVADPPAGPGVPLADVPALLSPLAGSATVVGRIPDALNPSRAPRVLDLVAALRAVGCDEIALDEAVDAGADASPEQSSPLHLRLLLQDAVQLAGVVPLRLCLRDDHGLGLVNALTAMKSGVRHFDTALAGCDGTLDTERLLLLCSRMGVGVPVESGPLAECRAELSRLVRRARPRRPA
ncbi:flavin reductase [Streptomyces sp. NPDC052052]|uniref:flavin reductase n=1 Tax=Streptomyces sp. NPDC052052 TaxID=3154756 RepID=UPI003437B282